MNRIREHGEDTSQLYDVLWPRGAPLEIGESTGIRDMCFGDVVDFFSQTTHLLI
jgi:hypothetical protein